MDIFIVLIVYFFFWYLGFSIMLVFFIERFFLFFFNVLIVLNLFKLIILYLLLFGSIIKRFIFVGLDIFLLFVVDRMFGMLVELLICLIEVFVCLRFWGGFLLFVVMVRSCVKVVVFCSWRFWRWMGCVEDVRWVLECENFFVFDDVMLSDLS